LRTETRFRIYFFEEMVPFMCGMRIIQIVIKVNWRFYIKLNNHPTIRKPKQKMSSLKW
jgi:hypothetical protein